MGLAKRSCQDEHSSNGRETSTEARCELRRSKPIAPYAHGAQPTHNSKARLARAIGGKKKHRAAFQFQPLLTKWPHTQDRLLRESSFRVSAPKFPKLFDTLAAGLNLALPGFYQASNVAE